MVLNVHRNPQGLLGTGRRRVGGGGGMEVGKEGGCIHNNYYRYTVTTKMTPSLRQAAMRAILMFQ